MSSLQTADETAGGALAEGRGGRLALEWLILVLLLANSAAYLFLSDTFVEGGEWLLHGQATREELLEGRMAGWLRNHSYYPPLPALFMACYPGSLHPLPAAGLLLWGLLPVLASVGWLARSVDAGTRRECRAGALFLVCMGGLPLFNAYTKIAHYEAGLLAAQSGILALLCGSPGLPSRRGCLAMGALVAAGMLCKWTFPIYCLPAIAIAAVLAWCRGLPAREVGLRLALAGLTASALAGPWYALCLNWDRLAATAGNHPSYPGSTGLEAYRLGLEMQAEFWLVSAGTALAPLLLAGVALDLRRRREALTCLSSVVVPTLVLAGLGHLEVRYLLGALPGLVASAVTGLASLRGRALTVVVLALAGVSLYQSARGTWLRWVDARPDWMCGGRHGFEQDLTMLWQSERPARFAWQRADWWSRMLAPRDREEATLACHPLDSHTGLQSMRFRMCFERTDRKPLVCFEGFDPLDYQSFLEALRANALTFFVLSEHALLIDLAQARQAAADALGFVPQVGELLNRPPEALPAEPFALEALERRMGVLEQLPEPDGKLYLLVRRESWERGLDRRPLGRLPAPSRYEHNTEEP